MDGTKINYRRAAIFPVFALLLASAAGVVLMGLRVVWTGHFRYLFLIWNLVLAWMPLVFALAFCHMHQSGVRRGWKLFSLAGLWLLFFPNAPYIFTDMIHLNAFLRGHYWADLTLILLFGMTGSLAGFVSLYFMQSVVAHRMGRAASWLFVLTAAGLGGLGVYLGRVLRWNSWDALINPTGVLGDIANLAVHPRANAHSLVFAVSFGTFLFFSYLMLYALTHLPVAQRQEVATG